MPLTIVFLDRETFPPSANFRRPAFDHEWIEFGRTAPDEVAERLEAADIAITNKAPIREAAIERLPRLRMIAVAATGTDNVDLPACERRGIVVRNVRGYAAHSVAEHTFALILALKRSLLSYANDVRAGEWQRSPHFCFLDYPIGDVHGLQLGLVGKGTIGRAVARLGEAFGMRVVFAARKEGGDGSGDLPWPEFLATSDIISLHCPLTEATRNLIAWREFEGMARRPLLINTARGGVVNEADLARALKGGLIAGAGFDVAQREPLSDDSPLVEVLDHPNVLMTPHVAWASAQAIETLTDQLIDNIDEFGRAIGAS